MKSITLERYFLESEKNKRLLSYENGIDLGRLKIFLASVSFEEDVLLMLGMLKRAGIERDRRKRVFPIIIAGGAFVTIAPQVFKNIADVIYTGYLGSHQKKKFSNILQKDFQEKSTLLKEFSKIKGAYVPDYNTVNTINYPESAEFEESVYIAEETQFSNMLLLEIGRGCPFSCCFCSLGHIYKKVLWRDEEEIIKICRKAHRTSKERLNNIGLIAPVPNFHPQIKSILKTLSSIGFKVSLSSLRVGNTDKEFFEIFKKCGQRTFTIAPEVPGEDEREAIGKRLKTEHIYECLTNAFSAGFREVKMYFLIGIKGMDNKNDVLELKRFLNAIPVHMKIKLSFNPFVPKPGTPFEMKEMMNKTKLKKLMNLIKKEISSFKTVSMKFGSLKSFELQYKIAHADENTIFNLHFS